MDTFYYPVQTDPTEPNNYETNVLAGNADTYEGFYLDWFPNF